MCRGPTVSGLSQWSNVTGQCLFREAKAYFAIQRAPKQAPKPTIKLLVRNTPTPNLASTTTEHGSNQIVGCNKDSPGKTTEAVKVIDKGSKLAAKTANDDKIPELSRSKKRLADADLEGNDHKKTKQNPDLSSNPKRSGEDREVDRKPMSKVAPEAHKLKGRAEEDLEGHRQKRQKTGSEPGRDGPSATQIARDRRVRKRTAGLRNGSNTCYYNAVLQTLVQTEPIREFCLARAAESAHINPSEVVVGKHATRQNAQTKAWATDLFANVDPDDM